METVATSVRINADAAHVLADLAAKLEKPKAEVIEMARRTLKRGSSGQMCSARLIDRPPIL